MPFPRSKKVHDEASLYDYAIGALGRRMRTVAELKRLLRQKQIAGEAGEKEAVIESVVGRLKEQRYLNDSQYAATYATLRRDGNKFGQQRVVNDLKVKGVHGDVIATHVDAAYEGVDEETQAREYLRRKRIKQPSRGKRNDASSLKKSQQETAKVFRALVRAGFRTGTIIGILKKWDVEDELLSELQDER